jgi:predicted DNA-binding protein (MmcQ/YjbR family)
MTIEDIEALCDGQPGVTKDIKWDDHLCFNIGGKMFLVTMPDSTPPTATFKVPPDQFEELIAREGFAAAAHIGRYHWVTVDDISKLTYKEWERYLLQSFILVAAKLPKKQRIELGIPDFK